MDFGERASGRPGALSRFRTARFRPMLGGQTLFALFALFALSAAGACSPAGDGARDGDADGGNGSAVITLPGDRAVVVPFQYRDDEAQHRLQLRIVNHSQQPYEVDALRLRWSGLTSPVAAAGLTV